MICKQPYMVVPLLAVTSLSACPAKESGDMGAATEGPSGAEGSSSGGATAGTTAVGQETDGSSESGTDGEGSPPWAPCEGGRELELAVDPVTPSGVIACPDGTLEARGLREQCPELVALEPCASFGSCSEDSDCQAGPNGTCYYVGDDAGCACAFQCLTGSDCAAGESCLCATGGLVHNACSLAPCRSADDCDGAACAFFLGSARGASTACRSEADECRTDTDCGGGRTCGYSSDVESFICWGP